MEEIKEQKNKKSYAKQIGWTLVGLAFVLLVLTTFEFVYPIKAFMLGTFGIMLYPILVFSLIFGAGLISSRKFVYSARYILYLFLCFFFLMCVFHIIFTSFSGQDFSYFNSVYTPGGLIIGVFTFPVTSLLHEIAGIVIYAIAFIISLYFVLSYLDSIKQSKTPAVVEPRRYENFNTITTDLQQVEEDDDQGKIEDEELFEQLEGTEEVEEDEDSIFVKDEEESPEVNLAKEKLGLKPRKEENPFDDRPETPTNKLFGNTNNETWQNRALNNTKDDRPQKIVYENNQPTVKPKVNPLYEKNKEYLNTLYQPNYDIKNPIINAENYDDYKEKMRLYNEQNSRPLKRDFELNVNQTLQPEANKPQEIKTQEPIKNEFSPKNIFDSNFGIEPNRIVRDFNAKPTFNNAFETKFEPKLDKFEEDISTSSIECLEDDFIKPFNPFEQKVSPLNPVNFDLNQQKFEKQEPVIESSQKFMEKEEVNTSTPFDTTKLSDGDVSTSLGNTYNLPKSLMNSNMSASVSAANYSPAEIAKANEPQLGFEGAYIKPPIDLLENYVNEADTSTNHERNIDVLEKVLEQFGIPAKVEAVRRGAAFTRYELHMPMGISVRKIQAHASDIALALAAKGDIRIEAPIKGKSAVGIEVPNTQIDKVGLRDIISSPEFNKASSPLTFALGKDVDGSVYCCNLAKMPHLLVAGSTGSGKSVCLNALLLSLIYRTSPEDLRLILVDPKRVEFGIYNNLPHLLMPKVITEPKKALNAFDWLINEMERRFTVFQDCYVKNINEYNAQPEVVEKKWQKMPYIVLVVDELADLVVTTNKKELEEKIIRLTQKARAAGIHVILATQRPSVDIITGSIKINLPARIAFAVSQFVDSKTIIDQGGAEKLLGRGDMLYSPSDGEPLRVQGAFVDTPEVKRIVDFVKDNNKAVYDEKVTRIINSENGPAGGGGVGNTATVGASSGEEFDSLMPDALKLVIENGQASISMLQRRFSIGFSRAARIIDQMELAKFISSSDGSKPRNVFITMDDYNKIYGNK